ncbi:MAG: hypothetical protein PHQ40_13140, partial [Anaerolineaceae bacterium]|nr:hypothetical protein [Anaerolineaceae bacterium]
GLRSADEAPQAQAWVDQLSARGSTDINRALLEAASMASSERPTYLIFLTDGLPTNGITDSNQILANFAQNAPKDLRLFVFGVGYDVDTMLLDSLSEQHHGATTYVRPGDALDEILSGFYARISTPVLTSLKLDFGGTPTYDLYPNPLPDLFLGSQIVAVGRYRAGGNVDVTLTGLVNGQTQTFTYPEQVFSRDSSAGDATLAALPRLWATRKIGFLLNQVRLKGADQETIDQIVHLSIRYGIVTPYTSYLVTEPAALGADAQQRIAQEQYNQMQAMPSAPVSGQAAVDKASGMSGLAGAEAPAAASSDNQSVVRVVGARTFVQADGVWTDTAFDPKTMQTIKVSFLSNDYFALVQSNPDVAAAFALGQRVIALAGNKAYEVVAAEEATPPLHLEPAATTNPANPTAVAPTMVPGALKPTVTPNSTPVASANLNPEKASLAFPIALVIIIPVALIWVLRR